MKNIYVILALVCSIVFSSKPLYAEGLGKALKRTIKTNEEILSYDKKADSVGQKINQAFASFLPDLSVSKSYMKIDEVKGSGFSKMMFPEESLSLTLNQPIFLAGQAYYSLKSAKRMYEAELLSTQTKKDGILIDAATTYMEVFTNDAKYDLNKKSVKLREEQLKSANQMFDAGTSTKTDVFTAESLYQEARAKASLIDGKIATAKEKYKQFTGLYPESLKLPFVIPLNIPQTKDEFIDSVKTNNLRIKLAEKYYLMYNASKKSKVSNFLPQINGSVKYTDNQMRDSQYDQEQTQFAITGTMPLFKGGSNLSQYKEAMYLSESYALSYENTKKEVLTSASSLWENFRSAKLSKMAYKNQVKASKNALNATAIEYRMGKKTIFDMLNAESEYLNSSVNFLDAQTNEVIYYLQIISYTGNLVDFFKG